MDPVYSDAIVEWASKSLLTSAFIVYDPIEPNDAFGKVMHQNLKVSLNERTFKS